jgi:hypothetical protein
MSKALVTLYDDNYKHIAEITLPNIKRYCNKFGYDLEIFTESLDTERHIYWSKIKAVKTLAQKYDYVFWCDIDSLFTRFDRDYIDAHHNGTLGTVNCLDRQPKDSTECAYSVSQMIFSGGEEIIRMMDTIYNQTQFLGHIWPEQLALVEVCQTIYPEHVQFAPIAKIIDPIDFLDGKVRYKIGSDDVVTVGGGPGAKDYKEEFLKLVSRMVK